MNRDWRQFADSLTALAKSEGQIDFLDQAFEFVNSFVTVDSCSVFKVSVDKKSGALHLCTFGALQPSLAAQLAQDYVANGFKNDPMVQTALTSKNIRVRRLPSSHYSSDYRSQYFEKAGLIDKVSSIYASTNALYLLNFYRAKNHAAFSTEDFNDLERLAPILSRFVLRHTQLTQTQSTEDGSFKRRITQLLNDNTQVFAALSPREKEIAGLILLGQPEKDIAEDLKLSLNTVITHRRRFYAKLNIGSKTELFQLAIIN